MTDPDIIDLTQKPNQSELDSKLNSVMDIFKSGVLSQISKQSNSSVGNYDSNSSSGVGSSFSSFVDDNQIATSFKRLANQNSKSSSETKIIKTSAWPDNTRRPGDKAKSPVIRATEPVGTESVKELPASRPKISKYNDFAMPTKTSEIGQNLAHVQNKLSQLSDTRNLTQVKIGSQNNLDLNTAASVQLNFQEQPKSQDQNQNRVRNESSSSINQLQSLNQPPIIQLTPPPLIAPPIFLPFFTGPSGPTEEKVCEPKNLGALLNRKYSKRFLHCNNQLKQPNFLINIPVYYLSNTRKEGVNKGCKEILQVFVSQPLISLTHPSINYENFQTGSKILLPTNLCEETITQIFNYIHGVPVNWTSVFPNIMGNKIRAASQEGMNIMCQSIITIMYFRVEELLKMNPFQWLTNNRTIGTQRQAMYFNQLRQKAHDLYKPVFTNVAPEDLDISMFPGPAMRLGKKNQDSDEEEVDEEGDPRNKTNKPPKFKSNVITPDNQFPIYNSGQTLSDQHFADKTHRCAIGTELSKIPIIDSILNEEIKNINRSDFLAQPYAVKKMQQIAELVDTISQLKGGLEIKELVAGMPKRTTDDEKTWKIQEKECLLNRECNDLRGAVVKAEHIHVKQQQIRKVTLENQRKNEINMALGHLNQLKDNPKPQNKPTKIPIPGLISRDGTGFDKQAELDHHQKRNIAKSNPADPTNNSRSNFCDACFRIFKYCECRNVKKKDVPDWVDSQINSSRSHDRRSQTSSDNNRNKNYGNLPRENYRDDYSKNFRYDPPSGRDFSKTEFKNSRSDGRKERENRDRYERDRSERRRDRDRDRRR